MRTGQPIENEILKIHVTGEGGEPQFMSKSARDAI